MHPLATGTDSLLQYGPLGIFAALAVYALTFLVRGVIKDKEGERSRAERLENELKQQNQYMQEHLIPTVLQMIAITGEMNLNSKAMMDLVTRLEYEMRLK